MDSWYVLKALILETTPRAMQYSAPTVDNASEKLDMKTPRDFVDYTSEWVGTIRVT
jgi:hypothetical protein